MENYEGQVSSEARDYVGQGYGNENALRLRIETDGLLDKVEEFLTGNKTIYGNDESGKLVVQKIPFGVPLCNKLGTQQIMQLCSQVINQHLVQGNLSSDEINMITADIKMDLSWELMMNWQLWGVNPRNRQHITRTIEKTARIFLSRTKDNKERESYAQTFRSYESVQEGQRKGMGWNIFGKNRAE